MSANVEVGKHEHVWMAKMHVDGCHFYSWSYSCECSATRDISAERKMREGLGPVWAIDDCERCQELLGGARRKPRRDRISAPEAAS